MAVGLGIWLGPEAVEPEGAIEELVGAEPAAGAVTVPIPAGVGAGDDREPLLGTDPSPGPASIWAAGVDEIWLGAAGTGGLEESVVPLGAEMLVPVELVAGPGALAALEEGWAGCCAGVLIPAAAGVCTVIARPLSTRLVPSMTR